MGLLQQLFGRTGQSLAAKLNPSHHNHLKFPIQVFLACNQVLACHMTYELYTLNFKLRSFEWGILNVYIIRTLKLLNEHPGHPC